MARPNNEVGALLQEYADLLSITGGPAYKARVYEKAARAVAGYHEDVSTLDEQELRQISGVGASIAEKVAEYLRTGGIEVVDELRAQIPAGVRELTAIPNLGPKKAMQLYEELGISSTEQLLQALDEEKVRDLKGFGPKTEEKIRHGMRLLNQTGGRTQLDVATDVAEQVIAELRNITGAERVEFAGSLRRMRETVGDVDILAASEDPDALMTAFTELPSVQEVVVRGDTKTSIRTLAGLQIDLRVVTPDVWGAALQYFTGSKAHNIRTRELALHNGLKLSEYGLFDAETGDLVVSETEEEVYERLGLPWIPPTLREDRGEIEAALRDELPDLVTEQDLRGDLHTHTNLTDGVSTVERMVAEAARRHYSYYAVTDHAPNLFMQQMSDAKALRQRERIRALDRKHSSLHLLHGTELNIGPDGEVDWPEDFLAGFDLCVASVHSHFTQSQREMTRRLVRACENPYVNIIGHPTARILGRRPSVDADLDEVFRACARTGTALEINGLPDRLDLPDEHIDRARRLGVKFAIDSDAHSTVHLGFVRYGVGAAQRGWLTPADVINTWPLRRLRTFLRKNR